MPPTARVRDLRKRYGQVDAVAGVTFDIAPGEVFGLLGPNGAGKTTTIECLLGLRTPDAGDIEICGIDARARPLAVKEKVGAALQTTGLQDKITPREALDLFGSFYAVRVDTQTLLERFGLTAKADAAFGALSGGQRQRLALALAFINRPELVVLDEPTAGLDPESRRELHGEIRRMRDDGCTVLFTTHRLDEAEMLCDRLAVVHRGRVIAMGAPAELIAQSRATPVISVSTEAPIDWAWLRAIPAVAEIETKTGGAAARFRAPDVNAALAIVIAQIAAQGARISTMDVRRASLEDVFLELTRDTRTTLEAAPAGGVR